MDLGSIFLILALLMLVALFIGRPFFEKQKAVRKRSQISGEDHEHSALLAERDRVLTALQELDFDHVLGKIPEEDYPLQRTLLLQQGADVLRKLDALEPEPQPADAEARLEAAIAARRADLQAVAVGSGNGRSRGVSTAVASPDDDLEVLLATRRRERKEKATGFCPKCGAPLQKSDRFCPRCGAKTA